MHAFEGPIVNSHNEWDPLEEVIVGSLDGAVNPAWEVALQAVTPAEQVERARDFAMEHGGQPVLPRIREPAQEELERIRAQFSEGKASSFDNPMVSIMERPFQHPTGRSGAAIATLAHGTC